MSKRVALLLVLVFLTASSMLVAKPVFSSTDIPGSIIITEDGSVEGTNKIQRVGNVYTFTGDIEISGGYTYSGIQVLKDNIVIDGAHHTLNTQDSGNNGIDLSERNDVTVKNLVIRGFKQGVFLEGSSGNTIFRNEIIGFKGSGPYGVPTGIWVSFSNNNRIESNNVTSNIYFGILVQASSANNIIAGNTITGNGVGLALDYCPNNSLRNNRIYGNEHNFKLGHNTFAQFIQDIDNSNTVEGKPMCYWIGHHNETVPADAGFVALGNCTNITVENLTISHGYDSITLINTNESVITNNYLSNCGNGIFLKYCQNITVTQNTVSGNSDSGIGTTSCDKIVIAENRIDQCNFGISPAGQTSNHSGGRGSTNMVIFRNNITNCNPGIYFSLSSNNLISQNLFRGNAYGVNLVASSKNNFTENTFIENSGGALRISDAYNNTFLHNNFIGNELDSQVLTQWYFGSAYETNVWDDGQEGNYWSNFEDRYPNASKNPRTKTWNTAFYIDEVNIDHYPLVNPHEIGTDEPADSLLPLITPSPNQSTSEPLPTVLVTVSVALIAIVGIGLIVYLKKRKH
jgi:parallel beta-helix repeat protein